MTIGGDTIMILPGEPSKKARIHERTLVSTVNAIAGTVTAQTDAAPVDGNEQYGVDVTQWQSVKVFHFAPADDDNFHGSKVTITPWYWYSPTSYYVPFASAGAVAPAHGTWICGRDVQLALDGTFDAQSQFVTYTTNNADRMFFQVKTYHNGVPAPAPPVGAVLWFKQMVFGLVPRPSDGAAILAAVADPNSSGEIPGDGGGGGGGGTGTGEIVVYNATGAAAINLTTAEIGPFELVDVTVHFSTGGAPHTSENLLVTLNAANGAAYDTVLLTVNPSTYLGGVTDICWKPESRFFFETGDQIVLTFPNTDTHTYGARIVIAR
jgi:hypothetical protein